MSAPAFREAFRLTSKQPIRWFPGHMGKGLKQMEQKLKMVDCIIEVHDARIPLSGRNPNFQQTLAGGGLKPHVLVLNKRDMSERRDQRRIMKTLNEPQYGGVEHVIFTNCKDQQCAGVRQLLPLASQLVASSERYNRSCEKDMCVMIIGVPNVGKSSLLNVLRNRHLRKKGATQVGAVAGVTRSVLQKIKISDDPLTYMIDTPGILEPCISDDEMGMKLALVGCMQDHLVGVDLIADYLLYWMNQQGRFEYVPLMGLEQPSDKIHEVLIGGAKFLDAKRLIKRFDGSVALMPDLMLAARHLIKLFRRGSLGVFNLDNHFLRSR